MNTLKFLTFSLLTVVSVNALAYGGGSSSKKACKKPKFTQFTPPHLSDVVPQSEFSFKTSVLTNPDSIQVSVKKQAVEVTISEVSNSYLVTGKLPATLQGTFARVSIKATGTNNCKGKDGWLLKIEAMNP